VIVRVNAMDTPHFEADVAAVVRPGLHVLNLPKPESRDDVRCRHGAIRKAERANGVTQAGAAAAERRDAARLRKAAELAKSDRG
jgi:citrate lyase beta subunit